jgi:hypothetical protein
MSDGQLVTFIAALVSAGASLTVAAFTISNSRAIDQVIAGRSLLSKDLPELGNELYAIVAFSKKMIYAKTEQSFSDARLKADESAKKLDQLWRTNRYALWGIDDGFRTIKWCPVYIAHHKDKRTGEGAKTIIEMSTSLREKMDKVIMKSYLQGKRPSFIQRKFIMYRAKKLRKFFDNGAQPKSPP